MTINSVKHLKINEDEDLRGQGAVVLVIRSLVPNTKNSFSRIFHIIDSMK